MPSNVHLDEPVTQTALNTSQVKTKKKKLLEILRGTPQTSDLLKAIGEAHHLVVFPAEADHV